MIIPLTDLFLGQKGKIISIDLKEEDKNRLIAMGFIPGKEIELAHISPFGDPLVFKVGDKKIVLRLSEAENIFVEVEYKIESLFESDLGKHQIISVCGGHHFKEEMRNLGIREGKIVTILGRNCHKTLIEVEGKKYAIGKWRAQKIFCKKVAQEWT